MNFTEEQKNKIEALEKKYIKRVWWFISIKNAAILFCLTVLSLFVNRCFFKPLNLTFAFVCGMLNGFVFIHLQRNDYLEADKEITAEEIKKILEE